MSGRWLGAGIGIAVAVGAAVLWWSAAPVDSLEPSPCALPGAPAATGSFIRPEDGAVVHSPWHLVRFTAPALSTVEVCLNGVPLDDPGAQLTPAADPAELDYIASLDLSDLDPGEHRLTAAIRPAQGEPMLLATTFTYARRPHRVRVRVTDGAGRPTSARVVVANAGGRVALAEPNGEITTRNPRDQVVYSFFAMNGEGTIFLGPGDYRLLAVRSLFDHVGTAEVALDGDAEVDLQVADAVRVDPYLIADLHVHTALSRDSQLPHRLRFQSLLAAGLDVAVMTDHNRVGAFADIVDALDGDTPEPLHLVPGIEATMFLEEARSNAGRDLGHFNAFPVLDAEAEPFPGRYGNDPAAYIDGYRDRQRRAPYPDVGERVLLQLNHPRGIHFGNKAEPSPGAFPMFNMLDFDPAVPVGEGTNAWMTRRRASTGTTPLDFDAIELVNRFSWELYLAVRTDWFALLNQGYALTATGNSDSHALEMEVAGFAVNLVRAPRPDAGQPLDVDAFLDGIVAGRVLVSTGPLVELEVRGDNGEVARPGDLQSVSGPTATVRVRAAPWVPVPEVRLVVDGRIVLRQPLPADPGGIDHIVEVPIETAADAWVVAEAGWPLDALEPVGGDYALLAPKYTPFGFTNPVRIDADEDGRWTPPGL